GLGGGGGQETAKEKNSPKQRPRASLCEEKRERRPASTRKQAPVMVNELARTTIPCRGLYHARAAGQSRRGCPHRESSNRLQHRRPAPDRAAAAPAHRLRLSGTGRRGGSDPDRKPEGIRAHPLRATHPGRRVAAVSEGHRIRQDVR